MSHPSIRPSKLSNAIAEHVQRLILEGALQPGEFLVSERDLAERLGVSRPSLREALAKLIELGLLTNDARGSCYVSDTIGKSIRDPLLQLLEAPEGTLDYLEFRSVIEGAAAGLAARRSSDVDRQAIEGHFNRMVEAQHLDDANVHAEADANFHLAIYEASHNLVLLHVMRSFELLLRSHVAFNRKTLYEHRGMSEELLEEHRAIHDAIMARDADAAREAAQHHVNNTLETMREIQEAEKRLQVSIRRLARSDLVASPRKKARG